ncbi:MAG: hypothetical protein WBA41_04075 [Rivularia sp. (in: cyanobacteria)]
MLSTAPNYQITWEKLPNDFVLENEPVDNINQPSLTAALSHSLEITSKLPNNSLTTTNYCIDATVNLKMLLPTPSSPYF